MKLTKFLSIFLSLIFFITPIQSKGTETPKEMLDKALIQQLTEPIYKVIGSDWFRGNEKIVTIKNDNKNQNILYVTVQVVSLQWAHSEPYIEERITFRILNNDIKPIDYYNRIIPKSEYDKFHIQ